MAERDGGLPSRRTEPDAPPSRRVGRRSFLGALGAGAAAAALPGCNQPPAEKIVPYVRRPPEVVPGESSFYATATTRDGYAIGLVAETREGRPIKVEGHPDHPMSQGATGMWEQASLYGVYDPDRLQAVQHRRRPATWDALGRALSPDRAPHGRSGEGLHLWLAPTSSPTTAHLLSRLRAQLPRVRVGFDPSAAPVARWEGARRLYGEVLEPHCDFRRADVVLSLDSDFLTAGPASLRWARDFAARRHVEEASDPMNRLYAVGPLVEVTSAHADHRLMVRASEVSIVAREVFAELAQRVAVPEGLAAMERGEAPGGDRGRWIRAVAQDLAAAGNRAAVVAGDHQPPEVHVLALAMNELLGSTGATTWLAPSPIVGAGGTGFDPDPLLDALGAGQVRTLFVAGTNPVYAAPFRDALRRLLPKAKERVHLTPHRNETTALATWAVPEAHYLEAWADHRSYDGTHTLTQPTIRPIFGGRTVDQVLAALLGDPDRSARGLVGSAWAEQGATAPPLEEALAQGFVEGSGYGRRRPEPQWDSVAEALRRSGAGSDGAMELVVRPDPCLRDGRHANNPWLQELPEPITHTVWDNCALLSEGEATRLGVRQGDVVRVSAGDRSVELPAYPQPGQPDGVVGVWLGYGRTGDEHAARGVGRDVGALRSADHPWHVPGLKVEATGGQRDLVSTQWEDWDHDRDIARSTTLDHFRSHPELPEIGGPAPPSIYEKRLDTDPQWGMVVDLTTCTGCSACVVACQAENNIPVVGKVQVGMGREMHWLRIDRYYTGDPSDPAVRVQPMMCQHCEKAPCEYVCPVNATVHSSDGLNEMVYNRCVGTRFCSNNCPYKVRRFNFLEWNGNLEPTEKMAKNPDVTVRARGVMEKCTYCVQRIRREQIAARREGVPLADRGLQTACQQACPSRAIAFGAIGEEGTDVHRWRGLPHAYGVLEDLGTHPRTLYLADVDNPHPDLKG